MRKNCPDPAQLLDDRALRLGTYIAEHGATVRQTAAVFGISKSTVHKDISARLPHLHAGLYAQVRGIIEKNKQERHIRGGLATKRKYALRRFRKAPDSKNFGEISVFPLTNRCQK